MRLYLLIDNKRKKTSVYLRKLNAVYDHCRFKRSDKVRLKEIDEEDFNFFTRGKKVHYADCIRTQNGFEPFTITEEVY